MYKIWRRPYVVVANMQNCDIAGSSDSIRTYFWTNTHGKTINYLIAQ